MSLALAEFECEGRGLVLVSAAVSLRLERKGKHLLRDIVRTGKTTGSEDDKKLENQESTQTDRDIKE